MSTDSLKFITDIFASAYVSESCSTEMLKMCLRSFTSIVAIIMYMLAAILLCWSQKSSICLALVKDPDIFYGPSC